MEKKKILFLQDTLGVGGAERQFTLLLKNLPDGWEKVVWALEAGPFKEELKKSDITVKTSPRKTRLDVSPAFNLWKLIIDYKPDIIHSWGWMSTLAAYPIAKIRNIPLVNGIIRTGKPYHYRTRISWFVSKLGDVVVSNSKAGLINWGIKSSRGVVIYNGFDEQRLSNLVALKPYKDDEKFVVVMAARMAKEKDFTLFISALRKLVEQGYTNWKFLAIGNGGDKEELIKENLDLIQKGYLEFPEAGLEVLPFLHVSDVGVLLTKPRYALEGCSNTILEYMACGLPVIASDSGGNSELVENNTTGFIIKDSSLQDLVNKLLWLFDNQSCAQLYGENGRERLNKYFTTEKMVKSTISLYESLLEKK